MTIDLRYGDTIEQMELIHDKSIDFICCDLPYGTTKNKWDSTIHFKQLWEQYERIIKDNGAIILFAQTPFDKILGASRIDLLKYEYIWNKKRPTGYMNANYAPMKQHENILVFSKASACFVKDKSKAMAFYPQDLIEVNRSIKRTAQNGNYDSLHYKLESNQKYTGYPTSILEFAPETGLHPTQKPILLMEFLIKTYSKENETVLDNTMGSCSSGIACINTNRNFIGIDNNMDYFNISLKRVEEKRKEKEFNLITSFGDKM